MYKKFLNCFHVCQFSPKINKVVDKCDRRIISNLVSPIISANSIHPLHYQSNCELYQVDDIYYTHFNKLKFKSKSIKTKFFKSSLNSLQ